MVVGKLVIDWWQRVDLHIYVYVSGQWILFFLGEETTCEKSKKRYYYHGLLCYVLDQRIGSIPTRRFHFWGVQGLGELSKACQNRATLLVGPNI